MKRWTILGAAAAAALLATTETAAQQTPRDTLPAAVDSLRTRMEEMELRLRRQEALLREREQRAMEAEEAATAGAVADTLPDQRQRTVSGIRSRPFVARFGRGTAVGGYMDHELIWTDDEVTFDQHRLIPFIFAEITDRIHFGTELEFEHGGEEIKVEFAALDIALADWLGVRGGIVLSPLGKFNLVHDSPVNDLTERPIVNRQIIPTTLSESGLGVFGTLYPSETSVLTYEAYVVNGFDAGLLDADDLDVRVRSGRGSQGEDNNREKSFVGRLGFSPFLGLEVGASAHTGVYAPDDAAERAALGLDGDERLTIWALDGIWNRGPFELLGEFARTSVDAPAGFAEAQQGYYVQGNVHFGHGLVPIFPSSVFTAAGRWDYVDYDADVDGDSQRRFTVGLNWRPVEETVVKLDYLTDWSAGPDADFGDAEDGVRFSLATYF